MNVPEGVIIDIDNINKYPPEKLVIITTGVKVNLCQLCQEWHQVNTEKLKL